MRTSAALSLLLAAGCTTDFSPRSVLVDLRVLALVAEPLEVGSEEAVTVRAVVVPPPGATLASERWSFCPLTTGASGGERCVVPECEVELPATGAAVGAGSVTARPGELARQCLARLSSGGVPAAVPSELIDPVPAVVRYVVTASNGERREAIQTVPLHLASLPAERNQPPVVLAADVAGRDVLRGEAAPPLVPRGTLTFRVQLDPASSQPFVDEVGVALQETLVVSFYTTAGRFDFDRANGPDAIVTLEHEEIAPGTTEAQLWAVARDLRGGQTVVGPFRVPVEP